MPACQLREFLYIFDTVLKDTRFPSFVKDVEVVDVLVEGGRSEEKRAGEHERSNGINRKQDAG